MTISETANVSLYDWSVSVDQHTGSLVAVGKVHEDVSGLLKPDSIFRSEDVVDFDVEQMKLRTRTAVYELITND